jgi:hypothetical protein
MDRASRSQGRCQSDPACHGDCRCSAAVDLQFRRRDDRHDPCPDAFGNIDPSGGDGGYRPEPLQGCGDDGGKGRDAFLADLLPPDDAWRRVRGPSGLHHVPRLFHHPGFVGWSSRHDDRPAHHIPDQGGPELAICRRHRRFARHHLHGDFSRLRPDIRPVGYRGERANAGAREEIVHTPVGGPCRKHDHLGFSQSHRCGHLRVDGSETGKKDVEHAARASDSMLPVRSFWPFSRSPRFSFCRSRSRRRPS